MVNGRSWSFVKFLYHLSLVLVSVAESIPAAEQRIFGLFNIAMTRPEIDPDNISRVRMVHGSDDPQLMP